MEDKRALIGDHPGLQIRKREPVIGWLLLIEALAFLCCAAFGSFPVILTGPDDTVDRVIWLTLAGALGWISWCFLVSNGRTRRLRERLVAREPGRW